ncbi:SMP-30/gluconolactonase/LRE family protein [Parapusillimonas granuli]|uniref:SMP-30/gluconolactonase/LRE family protein n=1 Tax=Parapusillimonas granuli TaxID=380911 RepID=A0A853FVC0_9BURK|nr:gluconolactonase [Parapusillimonas granuli]MEB2400255.1 SMP-30/gluconolactonase/LRE family protein [Alcaligenaceae bacterium]NYT49915.1 SMP-30/gluconolactonase/LRE family protein [Parapusillimonas granuli]
MRAAADILSDRYPDPAVVALDDRFHRLVLPLAAVERIAGGSRWAEGPVWVGDGRYLLWSDIPNDRIMRWDEISGQTHVYRHASNHANGNTRDRQGRLITCEHLGRRVTRTEHDGRITVLADRYQGKRLNSPNDVVVKSDGSIWFTDPPFGIVGFYQGEKAEQELPANLYRLDPDSGELDVVAGDVQGPNGLAFSPDESRLYVVESRARPRNVLVFDVQPGGRTLAGGRVLFDAQDGTPDGLRVDVEGNLWCGWGMGTPELDGVRVFSPEGKLIGRIALPERCANLCFGGKHRNRLFMASCTSIYSLYVNTQGVAGG